MSKPKTNSKKTSAAREPERSASFPFTLVHGNDTIALDRSRVLLTFRSPPNEKTFYTLLESRHLVPENGGIGHAAPTEHFAITRTPVCRFVRTADGSAIPAATIRELQVERAIASVAPVYQRARTSGVRGLAAVLPKGLAIHFAQIERLDEVHPPQIEAVFESLRVRHDLAQSKYLTPLAYLATPDVLANAAHVIGPKLASALGSFAPTIWYELVAVVSAASVKPFDPTDSLYGPTGTDAETAGTQWSMHRSGARWAWGTQGGTRGSATVDTFLVDAGIDRSLVDLSGANITQYGVTSGLPDAATILPNDDHGTQIAGIIAAQHNDSGQSIAGWAPAGNLTSLRDGAGTTFTPLDTNTLLMKAINYAGANGTSPVLCIGLAAGSSSMFLDGTVQMALKSAANADVVVCVASGNFSTGSSDIAYTSAGGTVTPNLLICGATTLVNAAAPQLVTVSGANSTPDPGVGNDIWLNYAGGASVGSCYDANSEADLTVVAPGDQIVTTVRQSMGSYTMTAQGTSVAAAQVAGIAALVRANTPGITGPATVAKIIRTTAKVGTDPYTTPTTAQLVAGTTNPKMGYGRVDASAVLVHDADTDPTDQERADVMVKAGPIDDGFRPYAGDPSDPFWANGDVLVSSSATLVPTGIGPIGSAVDKMFSDAVTAGNTGISTPGGAPGKTTVVQYLFVRVSFATNAALVTSASARGIRVTAVLCAPSTSFSYPTDWEAGNDAFHVVATDESPINLSYVDRLDVGNVYVARLQIPVNSDFTQFQHACACVRVTAANDIAFSRAVPSGLAQQQYNNIVQRNLHFVT